MRVSVGGCYNGCIRVVAVWLDRHSAKQPSIFQGLEPITGDQRAYSRGDQRAYSRGGCDDDGAELCVESVCVFGVCADDRALLITAPRFARTWSRKAWRSRGRLAVCHTLVNTHVGQRMPIV
eukprot:1194589-Prorocentrum_minimum.AAC.7